MTTPAYPTITEELLAELEQLAGKAGAMALDSAQKVEAANGAMIECPVCSGEGYASAENDYCNFDNHAIGVEFYGIGPEFGLAEAYFRAANPATILALLQHVRELKADKDRLDAIESNCWDVRYNSSPNGEAGDSSIGIEIVGYFMDSPCERVVGENYSENLRAALDQAMKADAYPPERPEYD